MKVFSHFNIYGFSGNKYWLPNEGIPPLTTFIMVFSTVGSLIGDQA